MDLTFEAAEIGLDGQILDDFILAAWSKIQGPIYQVGAQITSGNRPQPQRADHERSGSGCQTLLLGYPEPARVGIEDGDAAVGAEEDEVVAQNVCSDVVAAQGTRLAAVAQDEF